jgi:hypothetical protein
VTGSQNPAAAPREPFTGFSKGNTIGTEEISNDIRVRERREKRVNGRGKREERRE